MPRLTLALALLCLASCAVTLGQEDGFRERVQAGCLSASSCRSLLDEAQARVQRCRPNTMGFVRCDEATADARVARGYVREFERGETLQRARAREASAADARAAYEQQVADRDHAVDVKKQNEERAQWLVLDVDGCAKRGSLSACDEIKRFVLAWPQSEHQEEAAVALRAGREIMAAADAQRDAARQKEAEEEAKRARWRASQPKPAAVAPTSAPPSGQVCCCDGTVSPTCTTVHSGCCSHHGGVCGC